MAAPIAPSIAALSSGSETFPLAREDAAYTATASGMDSAQYLNLLVLSAKTAVLRSPVIA